MKYLQNRLLKQLVTVFLASAVFLGFSAPVQAEESKEITFIDLDGNKSKLSDYRGKWVVVNLWATWCPPCLKEIPDLVMFHEAHAEKDAVVIGVNYEDIDPQKVKNFAESQMVNYPIVRFEGKPDGKTSPFGNLRGLPTTYMVTPEGQIVAARTGMVDGAMLEDFIKNFSQSR
ncbi:TlpA disulfide reductase family protein [Thiomicrorhabdus sp. 6S3-12]|uniref:TlpA disulfide reductase family protein n=1 Tax=Thiomicrorhabdus sp. 6S3-12 TaxID=2819681 RepID=UPI001AAC7A63|nr:TlpA disulfide reductase family protein [Thiomicrorhabdus sp. 6S3-12]MBO1924247.1 TlpA family protein disulfide reductase [Thiomicrorhabdus sp. 6S3-12]